MTTTSPGIFQVETWAAATARSRLDELMAVYKAAFLDHWEADPRQATRDRRGHVLNHLHRTDVAVIAALDDVDTVLGFTYGLPGLLGSWWHDTVHAALTPTEQAHWMSDCLEVVELHVHPRAQSQGIGRALIAELLKATSAATAMLSALTDPELPARRLYASLGFTVLREPFRFPGTALPYSILAADLRNQPMEIGVHEPPRNH